MRTNRPYRIKLVGTFEAESMNDVNDLLQNLEASAVSDGGMTNVSAFVDEDIAVERAPSPSPTDGDRTTARCVGCGGELYRETFDVPETESLAGSPPGWWWQCGDCGAHGNVQDAESAPTGGEAADARFEVGDLIVIHPESEAFEYGGDAPFGGWVTRSEPGASWVNVRYLSRCEADPDERQDGSGWRWGWPEHEIAVADLRPMAGRDLAELQQQHVDAMRAAAPCDGEAQKALELLRDRVDRYDRFCGSGRPAVAADVVVAAKAVLALAPAPSDGREAREPREGQRVRIASGDYAGRSGRYEGRCEVTNAHLVHVDGDAVTDEPVGCDRVEVLSETDTPTEGGDDGDR